MKNLCIVYNGREGSTAIVDSLSRHSFVLVPVVEHMDRRNVIKNFGKKFVSNIGAGIQKLILTGDYNSDLFDLHQGDFTPLSKSVVFKWRPFGDVMNLGDVFLKTDTSVFCLARRDLVNLGLSKYYNNRVLSKGGKKQNHPQFDVKKMSQDERERYIDSLRSNKFAVDVDDFISDIKSYMDEKKALFGKMDLLKSCGVNVGYGYYEDFLNNKDDFLKNLLGLVDLEWEDGVLVTDYIRVNNPDMRNQVVNIDEIEKNSIVSELQADYSDLCESYFEE